VTFNDPAWLEQERRLLGALRRGDQTAFSSLYRAFAQPLYARVLLPKLGDRQAAEDVLAETFRIMLEKLDQYEDRGGSIWSWLATVAANKARDVERERARRGQALRGFALLSAPLLDAQPAGPGGDAQAADDGARLQAAVARVMDEINPRYRRALTLRFIEERPRVECAALLEVKVPTFDVLLLRALRAFRERWQADVAAGTPTATPGSVPVPVTA
jgi:RNA polymerase sigma-70 factor (ECF subfamily)